MEEWNNEKQKKKDNNFIFKALISCIIIFAIIISIILALLYVIKSSTVILSIDDKNVNFSENFIKTEGTIKYVNIKEMASLLGGQYHLGEYKVFSSDMDKCYIQYQNETASFYLNSDKVCKLGVGEYSEDYEICNFSTNTIQINGEFYAPIDAIEYGFNISFDIKDNKIEIITLPTLVELIEANINKDGKYNSLKNENFENKKALLYGYIVASKSDSNLYTVISIDGSKEIISDRYKKIEFIESTKEFLVTNSVDKVGIIDKDGKNKIDQLYDSIKVISSNPKLYLTELEQKYGVIDEDGNTIIYSEYDNIGFESNYSDLQNQYVLFDVIPVKKDNKYGLFDLKSNKILDVKYDGIGCNINSISIENNTKSVTPVVGISECNGIVIKNGETYDLFICDTKELIPLKVTSIYNIIEAGKSNYYMIYKNQELNLIENLIKLGYIKNYNIEEQEDIYEEENVTKENNIIQNISSNENVEEISNLIQ